MSGSIARKITKAEDFRLKLNLMWPYKAISALDFLDRLYGSDIDETLTMVLEKGRTGTDGKGTFVRVSGANTIINYFGRADAYMPSAQFFEGAYTKACLKRIYAFIVDIDYVSHQLLPILLALLKKLKHPPTMLVNSGQGVHLYWLFDAPVECYRKRMPFLARIQTALQNLFKSDVWKLDAHWVGHSYRLPGMQTKAKQIAQAFQITDRRYSVQELADWLIPLKKQQLKTDNVVSMGEDYQPNADHAFWSHCLSRVRYEVDMGHRKTAILAMITVGWKCNIRWDILQDTVKNLQVWYNSKEYRLLQEAKGNKWHRLTDSQINFTLKKYHNKNATRVNSYKLEEWFGFNFPRKTKRNYRDQHTHLEMARDIRNNKMASEKMDQVQRAMAAGLTTIRDIAEFTGLAKDTVSKYKKQLTPP